jgi:hypothetical protein
MGAAAQALPAPHWDDFINMVTALEDYRSLLEYVAAQIPARVLMHIKLRIRSDAMNLGPELIVTDDKGREYRSRLEAGFTMSDEFLAWLCVVE